MKIPTILLVEDSEDDEFFFKRALKKTGVDNQYFYVADGGQAIEFLRLAAAATSLEHPFPDVVFLDLKIPTVNGFDVLHWVRGQEALRELNVIVLSGSDHQEDRDRAKALGASHYLVKPIKAEVLRDHLQFDGESEVEDGMTGKAMPL